MAEFGVLLALVGVIVSIIVVIVFFVMADKISKIQKDVLEMRKRIAPDWLDHDFLAQREIYKENNDKALEHYQNLLFEIESGLKTKLAYVSRMKDLEYTKDCIKKLKSVRYREEPVSPKK